MSKAEIALSGATLTYLKRCGFRSLLNSVLVANNVSGKRANLARRMVVNCKAVRVFESELGRILNNGTADLSTCRDAADDLAAAAQLVNAAISECLSLIQLENAS